MPLRSQNILGGSIKKNTGLLGRALSQCRQAQPTRQTDRNVRGSTRSARKNSVRKSKINASTETEGSTISINITDPNSIYVTIHKTSEESVAVPPSKKTFSETETESEAELEKKRSCMLLKVPLVSESSDRYSKSDSSVNTGYASDEIDVDARTFSEEDLDRCFKRFIEKRKCNCPKKEIFGISTEKPVESRKDSKKPKRCVAFKTPTTDDICNCSIKTQVSFEDLDFDRYTTHPKDKESTSNIDYDVEETKDYIVLKPRGNKSHWEIDSKIPFLKNRRSSSPSVRPNSSPKENIIRPSTCRSTAPKSILRTKPKKYLSYNETLFHPEGNIKENSDEDFIRSVKLERDKCSHKSREISKNKLQFAKLYVKNRPRSRGGSSSAEDIHSEARRNRTSDSNTQHTASTSTHLREFQDCNSKEEELCNIAESSKKEYVRRKCSRGTRTEKDLDTIEEDSMKSKSTSANIEQFSINNRSITTKSQSFSEPRTHHRHQHLPEFQNKVLSENTYPQDLRNQPSSSNSSPHQIEDQGKDQYSRRIEEIDYQGTKEECSNSRPGSRHTEDSKRHQEYTKSRPFRRVEEREGSTSKSTEESNYQGTRQYSTKSNKNGSSKQFATQYLEEEPTTSHHRSTSQPTYPIKPRNITKELIIEPVASRGGWINQEDKIFSYRPEIISIQHRNTGRKPRSKKSTVEKFFNKLRFGSKDRSKSKSKKRENSPSPNRFVATGHYPSSRISREYSSERELHQIDYRDLECSSKEPKQHSSHSSKHFSGSKTHSGSTSPKGKSTSDLNQPYYTVLTAFDERTLREKYYKRLEMDQGRRKVPERRSRSENKYAMLHPPPARYYTYDVDTSEYSDMTECNECCRDRKKQVISTMICDSPDIYRSVFGPTLDETILTGISKFRTLVKHYKGDPEEDEEEPGTPHRHRMVPARKEYRAKYIKEERRQIEDDDRGYRSRQEEKDSREYRTRSIEEKGKGYRSKQVEDDREYRTKPTDEQGREYRSKQVEEDNREYKTKQVEGKEREYKSKPVEEDNLEYSTKPIEDTKQEYRLKQNSLEYRLKPKEEPNPIKKTESKTDIPKQATENCPCPYTKCSCANSVKSVGVQKKVYSQNTGTEVSNRRDTFDKHTQKTVHLSDKKICSYPACTCPNCEEVMFPPKLRLKHVGTEFERDTEYVDRGVSSIEVTKEPTRVQNIEEYENSQTTGFQTAMGDAPSTASRDNSSGTATSVTYPATSNMSYSSKRQSSDLTSSCPCSMDLEGRFPVKESQIQKIVSPTNSGKMLPTPIIDVSTEHLPGPRPPRSPDGNKNFTPTETRFAITKILKYDDFTTYEIYKSTKSKPKVLPKDTEGVFVLKNKLST